MIKFIKKLFKNKVFRVCIILLILTYPFTSDFRFFYSTGDSMLPTYENGELVLVYRSQSLGEDWEPRRSQVIIAVSDGDQLIKRVVGLEGEYVKIKNGYIYINGKKYKDSWTHQNITYWTEPEETRLNKPKNEWLFLNTDQDVGRVPKGHIWVIGDNRHMSWYGMVKMKDVKGWVLF